MEFTTEFTTLCTTAAQLLTRSAEDNSDSALKFSDTTSTSVALLVSRTL